MGLANWMGAWRDSLSRDAGTHTGQFMSSGLIVDCGWQLKGQFSADLAFLKRQGTVRISGVVNLF